MHLMKCTCEVYSSVIKSSIYLLNLVRMVFPEVYFDGPHNFYIKSDISWWILSWFFGLKPSIEYVTEQGECDNIKRLGFNWLKITYDDCNLRKPTIMSWSLNWGRVISLIMEKRDSFPLIIDINESFDGGTRPTICF